MKQGRQCGRPEGHKGQHCSVEALERHREYDREYMRGRWANDPENREYKLEYSREYMKGYRDEHREELREYGAVRYASDPKVRARCLIRGDVNSRLRKIGISGGISGQMAREKFGDLL